MKLVSVECPKCFKNYSIPEHLAGFIIECPDCKEKFYLSVNGTSHYVNGKVKDKKNGKEKRRFFGQKQKLPEIIEPQPARPRSSVRKPKVELSEEDKAFEKLIKERTYKYIDLIIQALGIFGALLVTISLFLPSIVISKAETISLFSASFDLKQIGAIISIISPEKFLFYFIILIPIGSILSIIVEIKNIIMKNASQMFYRLIFLVVCIAYFALASVLILGGGVKFDAQQPFVENVSKLNETGGFASIFKNVFTFGSMILFFGITILIIVNLLDFTMFLKRRKVEV